MQPATQDDMLPSAALIDFAASAAALPASLDALRRASWED